MTDFYALLKQSILTRQIHDPGQRQVVYAQARNALIRQLAVQEPRISNADIAVRVIEFDKAMRQIEAEIDAEIAAGEQAPVAPDETPAGPSEDTGDEAYAEPPQAVREASGWDVPTGAPEDELPLPPVEPEAPLHPGRPLPLAVRRGGLARRATPPPVLSESEDDLPPPYRDRWNDEEGLLEDQREGGTTALAPLAPPPPPRRLPPPQRRLGWTLSEKDKVWVLAGAIGALALVLIGLLVFLFLPGRSTGVTLPVETQGSVSDAAAATRIASQNLSVKQTFTVFDGHDPTVFQSSSDNPVRLDADAQGPYAQVGTSTSSTGTKVQIGPGLAASLAGQNIRVVVTARASAERGALNMRFAYQSGVALSHWQTANLAPAYAAAGMTWIVPASQTGPHYLLIEPGIPGDGTHVDIQSIRIDVLNGTPPTA